MYIEFILEAFTLLNNAYDFNHSDEFGNTSYPNMEIQQIQHNSLSSLPSMGSYVNNQNSHGTTPQRRLEVTTPSSAVYDTIDRTIDTHNTSNNNAFVESSSSSSSLNDTIAINKTIEKHTASNKN